MNSIPACNSYQHFKGECEKETAAAYDVGARMQIASLKESIPACNSAQHAAGECEKDTAAAYGVGARVQVGKESIPACDS